jgi:hypothetical protein
MLKLPEQDNEAGELDEAEEVLVIIFPADENALLCHSKICRLRK